MRKLTLNETKLVYGGKKEVEQAEQSVGEYLQEALGDVKEMFGGLFTDVSNWLGGISADVRNEVDKGVARAAKRGKKLGKKQEQGEL